MTLILFKCVSAARQDFINIFSTSCLLNTTARSSWQVSFTSHICEPRTVSCQVGLPFLSPDTNTMANVKCSFLELIYRAMCFSKVRASTHFTLHSWAGVLATGNLQGGWQKGAGWKLNLPKKVTSAGWQEKELMLGQATNWQWRAAGYWLSWARHFKSKEHSLSGD